MCPVLTWVLQVLVHATACSMDCLQGRVVIIDGLRNVIKWAGVPQTHSSGTGHSCMVDGGEQ